MKNVLLIGLSGLLLVACSATPAPTAAAQTPLQALKKGTPTPVPTPTPAPVPAPLPAPVPSLPCGPGGPGVLANKAYTLTFTYQDGHTRTGRWEATSNFNNTTGTADGPKEYADGQLTLDDGTRLFTQGMYAPYSSAGLHTGYSMFFAEQGGIGRGALSLPDEDSVGTFDAVNPVVTQEFELTLLRGLSRFTMTPVVNAPCSETYALTLTAADGTVSKASWTVYRAQNYGSVQLSQELWGSMTFDQGATLVAKGYRASQMIAGGNVTTAGGPNFYVIWIGDAGTQPNLVLTANADPDFSGQADRRISGSYRGLSAGSGGTFVAQRR